MNLFIFSRIVRRRGGGGRGREEIVRHVSTFFNFDYSWFNDSYRFITNFSIVSTRAAGTLSSISFLLRHFLKVSILSNWRTFFLFFFFFLSKRGGKISSLRKMKKLNRGRICDSLIMKYKKKSSISIRTRWDFYCDNSRKCVAIIFIWMYARAIIFNRTGNQIFHPFFYHFQSTRVCSF